LIKSDFYKISPVFQFPPFSWRLQRNSTENVCWTLRRRPPLSCSYEVDWNWERRSSCRFVSAFMFYFPCREI